MEMEESNIQGDSAFMLLPLEIRRIIYTFAVISVPLIELRINYYRDAINNAPDLDRVRLYTDQDFRMLATNHEFRKEMSDALYAKNAFDISLSREDAGEGTSLCQIDLRRIKKCRFTLHDIESSKRHGGPDPWYWYHHFRALIAPLALNDHHMEAMLVECQPQSSKHFLGFLRPMSMLRKVGLIHFRSASPETYPYLRFLEVVITSNQDVPFRTRNRQEFNDRTQAWLPPLYRGVGRRHPSRRSTNMTEEGTEKSLEEMDATRKRLYAILNIEDVDDGMGPPKDL